MQLLQLVSGDLVTTQVYLELARETPRPEEAGGHGEAEAVEPQPPVVASVPPPPSPEPSDGPRVACEPDSLMGR